MGFNLGFKGLKVNFIMTVFLPFQIANSLLQIHFSSKTLTMTSTTLQLRVARVLCTGRIFMAKTQQTAHLITLFWHMYNTYM